MRRRRTAPDFLTDVRIAARFGHPDALDEVLGRLLQDRAIAANRTLPSTRVQRELVPVGQALAQGAVPDAYLFSLAESPYAAYRAIAAAALAHRQAQNRDEARQAVLERLARDARDEVHVALAQTLAQVPASPALRAWLQDWLTRAQPPVSPRARALALRVAPRVFSPQALWARLPTVPDAGDARVQDALVEAFQAAARRAPQQAMDQLRAWWREGRWPPALIARAMSGPWLLTVTPQGLELLAELYRRYGRRRWLTQPLKMLAREGAISDVDALLRSWEEGGS
ncbi:MAG: hypothetical protein GXO36_01605 [Chloroflexi bacterium]|nr:hypothetical protein [Chloroflexota bacterium]